MTPNQIKELVARILDEERVREAIIEKAKI
jgi:hypothetical protein